MIFDPRKLEDQAFLLQHPSLKEDETEAVKILGPGHDTCLITTRDAPSADPGIQPWEDSSATVSSHVQYICVQGFKNVWKTTRTSALICHAQGANQKTLGTGHRLQTSANIRTLWNGSAMDMTGRLGNSLCIPGRLVRICKDM